MKKTVSFLVIVMLFFSCKEETVKKPDRLIDKEVMENIIYDISLLDAIKYNEPSTSEKYKVNPKEFIYRKYKIDSTQFSQSNMYYAADFDGYKAMYDKVIKRIDSKKAILDSVIKKEVKRDSLIVVKRKQDSIKGIKKVILAKKKDSLQKTKRKDSMLLSKKKTSIVTKKESLNKNATRIKKGNTVN